MQPLVIQTENLPQACSDWLASRVDLHTCPADSPRFMELLPEAEALVIRTYTTVDEEMIRVGNKLKVIGRAGVGIDNIDLFCCKKNNIKVVHTPNANSEAVVEFVLSTMLPRLRPLHQTETPLDIDAWKLHREASVNPKQFSEITIGIVGFGRVGSRLGTMAKCMGFRVVFADIKTIKDTHGCHQVEMAELLASSDVISIHVDGRAENNNLVSLEVLALMKHDVLFINTSRGFVVNPDELATHLSQNPNSYAILDVHDPEPFTVNYPLLGLNNTSLFPHIAAKTDTAMHNMGWVVRDVDKVLRGEDPMYQACI